MAATQGLARELGPHGIRVNSVVPGYIWGASLEGYFAHQAKQRGVTPQVVYDEVAAQTALRHLPTSEEIADAVVFFASDLSRVDHRAVARRERRARLPLTEFAGQARADHGRRLGDRPRDGAQARAAGRARGAARPASRRRPTRRRARSAASRWSPTCATPPRWTRRARRRRRRSAVSISRSSTPARDRWRRCTSTRPRTSSASSRVNLLGVYHGLRSAVPHLRAMR